MRKSGKPADSNLFAIDHEAILAVLKDANWKLLQRRDELLAALQRMPEKLQQSDQIERASVFMTQLQNAVSECRDARLSDGRPFTMASATVKSFFDDIDGPLRTALRSVKKSLTAAALKIRALDGGKSSQPIGIDSRGNEIVTAAIQPLPPRQPGGGIRLEWAVLGFERETLDLGALRPFLTDSAIMAACKKHLAANGPHRLSGVEYAEAVGNAP